MTAEALISKAEGFLELGLGEEAWNALEELPPEAKCQPDVYVLHLRILVLGQYWQKVEILAESLAPLLKDHPYVWLALAKAQVAQGRLVEATKSATRVSELAPHLRLTMLEDEQLAALWTT